MSDLPQLKAYTLAFEKRGSCLFVSLRADEIDRPTTLDYLAEIADACASEHVRSAVIERDIPMVLSDREMLETWKLFLDTGTKMNIALVNPHAEAAAPLKRMIAAARELNAETEYFEDLASAEHWIANAR